jgi:undecaprenyl-diphosphatase
MAPPAHLARLPAMTAKLRMAALGALALAWLAMLLLGAGGLDRSVLMALYAGDEPWLALAAIGFTYLGNWWTVVAVTLAASALLAWRGRRWEALLLLIVTFSGRALVILAKQWFARVRPEEHLRLVEVHYQSFPSGHAANAMLVYVGIAMLAFRDVQRRRRAVAAALLLTFLVGISRLMLGVHWPSDVIGGWTFGALWLLAVLWAGERLRATAITR